MNVTFYSVSKRRNSTKLPTGASASYSCLLKDDTTTSRPQLMIKWDGSSAAPAQYNYCYISAFRRYYWVNSWAYVDRQWVCSCSVDVLATYKTEIGAAKKFVTRSASAFNFFVADTLFPVDGKIKTTRAGIATNWATSLTNGSIVVGIMGVDGGYSAGGVSYYRVTPAGYMAMLKDLFSESLAKVNAETYGGTIGEAIKALSRNLLRSITNPQQYVKSVRWYPFSFSEGGGISATIGGITVTPTLYPIADPIKTQTITININTTPNTPAEYWANVAPYLTATAFIPPFGAFPIDTRKLCGARICELEIITDAISGQAHMRLAAVHGLSDKTTLAEATTALGIPLDFSGVSYGSGVSFGSVAGAAMSAAEGDVIGAASGILSALDSGAGRAQSHSSGYSGIAGFQAEKFIELNYMNPIADDDVYAEFGHALCAEMTISSLSGYVKCQDGEIECPATEEEHREIEAFLTGGFFYE